MREAQPSCLSLSRTNVFLTDALHEGGVEAVGQQRLRQLPEIQLQCSRDGVDVHVAQHHQDVFGVCSRDRRIRNTFYLSNSFHNIHMRLGVCQVFYVRLH